MVETHVRVILVHWNQPDACLGTIENFRDQGVPVAFTVVDNGSAPDKIERLRAGLADDVILLEQGRNLGFGPGSNAGLSHWLAHDTCEWAAVAPHDALPGDKALARIVDGLCEQPDVGLVSADVGDHATPVVHPYLGSIDAPQLIDEGLEESDYCHGTLHLFRRPCVEAIGLFDERYFAYCEEADLGLRAKAAGWRVGIMRGADVHNPHVGTPHPTIDYLKERNTLLLLWDHYGPMQVVYRTMVLVWQLIAGTIDPSMRGDYFSAPARVRALVDAARGRFGPPPASITNRG
ncbi:MAG: glycosyltransferase [Acidimicrobiia bacterium]|nr:glycosyltransferase [Acidimicrobiia bacterium]